KKFDAYLFILCRNHALNYVRKKVSEQQKQEAYIRRLDIIEEPDLVDEEKDYHALLDKAIPLLPPRQQQVFRLRLQGLKNSEISEKMNLSTDSVKKYHHLAIKYLSKILKAEVVISVVLWLRPF